MRETSVEAYHTIRDNGLLRKRRLQVYETLYFNGPMTKNEVWLAIKNSSVPGLSQDGVHQRFSELNLRGVIKCVGKRPCRVTGMTVMVWDVTKNLPVEPEKTKEKCKTCNGTGWVACAKKENA